MILLHALAHAAATTTTTLGTTTTTAAKSSSSGGLYSILDPIAKPLAEVMAAVYSVIPNYGVAIMGLSVIWMVIISPLTLRSTRSMLAMQKLQPEMKRLQAKHKDDRQAFAAAQMELYREHNVSPFGACLPMLLPMPVFIALFRVIDGLSHTTRTAGGLVRYTPQYLSPHSAMYKAILHGHGKLEAFGMDLSKTALAHHSGIAAAAPYWIVLLIMAGTSYFQSAMMMSRNPANANNPQARMMKFIAPVFALICIRFPAGVILYYATSNICRIIQQDAMYRFDPKVKKLVALDVIEVEEITEELDEQEQLRRSRPGYTPPRGPKELGDGKSQTPAKKTGAGSAGRGGKGNAGGKGNNAGTANAAARGGTGRNAGAGAKPSFREIWAQAQNERRKQVQTKNSGGTGNGKPSGSKSRPGGASGGGSGTRSGSGSGTRSGSAANKNKSGQNRGGGTSKGASGQSNKKRRGN